MQGSLGTDQLGIVVVVLLQFMVSCRVQGEMLKEDTLHTKLRGLTVPPTVSSCGASLLVCRRQS